MTNEDDESKDHQFWSGIARFWYNKAAKSPTFGAFSNEISPVLLILSFGPGRTSLLYLIS